MFKITVVLCFAGLVAAGEVSYSPAPSYSSSAPAISTVSFSTSAVPIAYSDRAAAVAVPVLYKKKVASYAPVSTAELSYSESPASSGYYTAHPAPLAYAAAPIRTESFAAPAVAYQAAPVVTKAYAPATYAVAPVVTKAVSSPAFVAYAAAPVLKSAVSYSSAPAVSHVTYKGSDTSYSW